MGCKNTNPLIRKGRNRMDRQLEALSPEYALVDERSIEDLMLFAKRYASYIKFRDEKNEESGNWEDLMKQDISVVLATLVSIDVFEISNYIKLLHKRIKLGIIGDDETEAKRQFKYLFDVFFTLSKIIDEQCSMLNDEQDYRQHLLSAIKNKLTGPFSKIHNFFNDHPELILQTNKTDVTAPIKTIDSLDVFVWENFVLSDESIPLTIAGETIGEKISSIVNHNLFNHQINLFLGGVSNILLNADKLLQESLNDYPKHEPHYALFITFLKLFGYAQKSLNQYSKKQLDFYYKEVLRLKIQPPRADKAHLIVQLQKHVGHHLISEGTLFKGGKDSAGKERFYKLIKDTVFNQALVKEIKGVQLVNENLLAYQQLNSHDGQGEDFEGEDKSWPAFGPKGYRPTLETGFAIASNLLFLNEGHRVISLHFRFSEASNLINRINTLKAQKKSADISLNLSLTGEEGWYEKEVVASFDTGGDKLSLKFNLTLEVEDPKIIPYTEKIHQSGFRTKLPLLIVKFGQTNIKYTELMEPNLDAFDLTVEVTGARDLALSNDSGTINASKPYKPFGDFPKIGASFYIGSKEIFQKKLTSLKVHLPLNVNMTCSYLHKNSWNPYNFNNSSKIVSANGGHNLLELAKMDFGPNETLDISSFEGFLRFQLNTAGYSLDDHMKKVNAYVEQVISKSAEGAGPLSRLALTNVGDKESLEISSIGSDLGIEEFKWEGLNEKVKSNLEHKLQYAHLVEDVKFYLDAVVLKKASIPVPNELIADSFSVDYSASGNFSSEGQIQEFYHINPFGYKKHKYGEGLSLIPRYKDEGELLLGIDQAKPPSMLKLLFLLVDGSSNPLKKEEQVKWAYLNDDNYWVDFDSSQIDDGTYNLTRSGIVDIDFPKTVGLNTTLLPSGKCWIKVSVSQNTDAVCRIISVEAQGALVELIQEGDSEFRELLLAESISKLKNSDPHVKSIRQPEDSFHGRPLETDENFYLRTSERLRHKNRAISIWDYEHLVLQEFPEVFKIKCLNHTGFYEEAGKKVFCENIPGHVTLITIPDLKNKSHINPLRPYTPIGTLTDIKIFLEKRKNPFVHLHVINPRFEEIRVEFKVRFHDRLDETYFKNLLDREIEQFLCPWAFDFSKEINFGGSIHKSSLINFVEERSYVDYVSCFRMHHIIRNEEGHIASEKFDLETVIASSGHAVLVSHFDEKQVQPRHKITVDQTCNC